MKQAEWLLVGLGNPGDKYENTRHNIGWSVINALCEKHNSPFKKHGNLFLLSELNIGRTPIAAALPLTFMNASGEAVSHLCKKMCIEPSKVLVVCDEYNFPLGNIHVKRGGSDGGHNGIYSIIYELDSEDFYRMRCGISKNFGQGELVDYVLSNFLSEEIPTKMQMLQDSVQALEYFFSNNSNRAMSDINSGKLWKKPDNTQQNRQTTKLTLSE